MELELIKNSKTKKIGKNIIYFEKLESTQDYAKKIVENENVDGTIVITNNQTKGKGTKDRRWIAKENENITMTIILKPNWEVSKLDGLTLNIAEEIQKGIKQLYGYNLTIKEPNDLLLNNKKICGILTQSSIISNKVKYVLIGIGVNVNQVEYDEELRKNSYVAKERI